MGSWTKVPSSLDSSTPRSSSPSCPSLLSKGWTEVVRARTCTINFIYAQCYLIHQLINQLIAISWPTLTIGKSRVSAHLAQKLKLDRMETPPPSIKHLKEFFDQQSEPIRRAYYSFGNYLAAEAVARSTFEHGIVMDRYFHSTAASALAHELSSHVSPG